MPVPTNDGNLTKRASQYLNNIEHDETTQAKGVAIYGTPDGANVYRLAVNADGSINTSGSSGGGTEYTEDTASSGGEVGPLVLGIRRDADTSPVSNDSDFHPLTFNSVGRLKVAAMPGDYSATVDTITSIGDTVSVDVSKASNVVAYCTGTFSTVNCTFEGSVDGGTSWFTVQAVRSNANTVETATGNLSAAPAYAWELSVNALTHMRIRATAWTSGTQTWTILPGAYATEPIPAIQTHAVTGSGNFAVTMAANATTTPSKARDGAAGATDTGIPAFYTRRDTPTSVTPIAGDYELAQIDAQGSQWVRPKIGQTGTSSNVSGSATSVTILAANTNRLGATIFNDSSANLYLKLGATASTTSFAVKLYPDGYFEVPANYSGIINGIWDSATGAARVTEITT